MKISLSIALVTLVLLGCKSSPQNPGSRPAPVLLDTPLPSSPVAPLAGGPAVPLEQVVKGKVAVIDLWASWCEACREVSKNVDLLAEVHKGDAFLAVGLDVGEEPLVVSRFLEGRMPAYPIYLDPEFRVPDALGATELPTVLVVDKNGRIRLIRRKIDGDVLRAVKDLLAQR